MWEEKQSTTQGPHKARARPFKSDTKPAFHHFSKLRKMTVGIKEKIKERGRGKDHTKLVKSRAEPHDKDYPQHLVQSPSPMPTPHVNNEHGIGG